MRYTPARGALAASGGAGKDGGDMKDGRYYNTGGEICDNCNKTYKTIYNVPDELWAEISGNPNGSGLLCIGCFDQLASMNGYKLLWKPELHEVYS